ncbi:hypothetical protein MBLNU230_g5743t1 [Neophaeotheca triangularis]
MADKNKDKTPAPEPMVMCLTCDLEAIRTDYRDKRPHGDRHQDALAQARPRLRLKGRNDVLGGPERRVDPIMGAVSVVLPDHHVDLTHSSLFEVIHKMGVKSALPISNVMRHLFTDREILQLISPTEAFDAKVEEMASKSGKVQADRANGDNLVIGPPTPVSEQLKQAIAEARLIYMKLLLRYNLLDWDLIYQSEAPLAQTKMYYEQMAMLKEVGGKTYDMTRYDPLTKQMFISVLVPRATFGKKFDQRVRKAARMDLAVNTPQAGTPRATVHKRTLLSASPPSRHGLSFSATGNKIEELVKEFKGRGRSGTLERSVNTAPGEWCPDGTVMRRLADLQPNWPSQSNPISRAPSPDGPNDPDQVVSDKKPANVDEEPSITKLIVREVEETGEHAFEPPSKTKSQDKWWERDLATRKATLEEYDANNIKHGLQGSQHHISRTGVNPEFAVEGVDYHAIPSMSNTYASASAAVSKPRRTPEIPVPVQEAAVPPPRNLSERPIEEQHVRATHALKQVQQHVRQIRSLLADEPESEDLANLVADAEKDEEAARQRYAETARAMRAKGLAQRALHVREQKSEALRQRKAEIEGMLDRQRESLALTLSDSNESSYISDASSSIHQPRWTAEPATRSAPARLTTANLQHHQTATRVSTSSSRAEPANTNTAFPSYVDPFATSAPQNHPMPTRASPSPVRAISPTASARASPPAPRYFGPVPPPAPPTAPRGSTASALSASIARIRGREAAGLPPVGMAELSGISATRGDVAGGSGAGGSGAGGSSAGSGLGARGSRTEGNEGQGKGKAKKDSVAVDKEDGGKK